MRRRRRSLVYRLVASAVVLVVFLGMAELAARIVGPQIPAWRAKDRPTTLLIGHSTRLWSIAPGVVTNGIGEATVSELGLREPIPETPRPTGRSRILVLGDSTIFGHGVPDDETLPIHLVNALRDRGVDVDSVNAGIPGYSSEQSLLLLDEIGWQLEPTLLVIANLWSDNNFDTWHDRDLLHTAQLFHDNPLRGSAAYTLAASWIDKTKGGTGARVITWTTTSGVPTDDVRRRVPLPDYAANLDEIAAEACRRNIGVAFLSLANRAIVEGTLTWAQWDNYFQAQKDLAEHHGAARTDASVPLKEAVAQGVSMDALFVDELHPSGEGQRLIATALADELVARGWPDEPQLGRCIEQYDTSGLVDPWNTQPAPPEKAQSPQDQLIKDADVAPLPGTPDHAEQQRDEYAMASNADTWLVEGTVSSPTAGPIVVELRDGDRTVGSARLRGPGDFRLQAPKTSPEVDVVVVDADGRTATQPAVRSAPTVEFDLR